MADSVGVSIARKLLDSAREQGFKFARMAPGDDSPLHGKRVTQLYIDELIINGFSDHCVGYRRRLSSLIVPSGMPISDQVEGNVLHVLSGVLEWPT